MTITRTPAGLDQAEAETVCERLQERLVALIDLSLVLKHVHWNVVGPSFIGVQEMLDPQVEAVHAMSDKVAERMAVLGGAPVGTVGYISKQRTWEDYSVGRAGTQAHLAALDLVYHGVIGDHRQLVEDVAELDVVTQDLLIGQVEQLELFQWFVRAHLEDSDGRLVHDGATSEAAAVEAVGGPDAL